MKTIGRATLLWSLGCVLLGCSGASSGGSGGGGSVGSATGTGGGAAGATVSGGSAGPSGNIDSGASRASGGSLGAGGTTATGGWAGQPTGEGGHDGAAGAGGGGPMTGSDGGGPGYPYIFAVFNDSAPVSSLQIYTSNDALNFTLLTDTGYTGPTGFLRDPSIMKHTDGKFYVTFTATPDLGCCGSQTSFGVASSSDLKHWTTVTTVPSGIAGTTNVWAPEWLKEPDGTVHVLVTINRSTTYRYEPSDDTLTKFGAATRIGIGPGCIDTFVVIVDGTYHAFTKCNNYIAHATSSVLDGPWIFVGMGDWAGWGTHKEGPAVIRLTNGTWRIYFDAGSTGHEMYSDSADGFKTWTAPKTLPAVGNNISHGTVIQGN